MQLLGLDQNLMYMDKFLQISFLVDGQRVFGYGERVSNFFLDDGTYTLYSQDHTYAKDEAKGGQQLSGVHPFVGVKLNSKGYLGIVFKNSNAQALEVSKYGDQKRLVFSTLGGILDFEFF